MIAEQKLQEAFVLDQASILDPNKPDWKSDKLPTYHPTKPKLSYLAFQEIRKTEY